MSPTRIGQMISKMRRADSKKLWLGMFGAIVSHCVLVQPLAVADERTKLTVRIDELIDESLQNRGILAAPAATDAEFLRRVHFDLIGRPPALSAVRQFLSYDD